MSEKEKKHEKPTIQWILRADVEYLQRKMVKIMSKNFVSNFLFEKSFLFYRRKRKKF